MTGVLFREPAGGKMDDKCKGEMYLICSLK